MQFDDHLAGRLGVAATNRASFYLYTVPEEIDQMILNGFAGAYLPWPERRVLLEEVRGVGEAQAGDPRQQASGLLGGVPRPALQALLGAAHLQLGQRAAARRDVEDVAVQEVEDPGAEGLAPAADLDVVVLVGAGRHIRQRQRRPLRGDRLLVGVDAVLALGGAVAAGAGDDDDEHQSASAGKHGCVAIVAADNIAAERGETLPMIDPSEVIQLPSTVAQGDRQIPRELLAHTAVVQEFRD